MSISTEAQATEPVRADVYGNEASRLAELKAMEYPVFKQWLIDTHNSLCESDSTLEPEHEFIDRANMNSGGQLFPRPEDKEMLLEHAFEQAKEQEDVQTAAMILNIAVVFTHPFVEANGRTARNIYAWLSRGITSKTNPAEFQILNRESMRPGGPAGRDLIDFGDKIDGFYGHWLDREVYETTDVDMVANCVWYKSADEVAARRHYDEREYHGLSSDERTELDSLLGEKTYGDMPQRYGANNSAITYGFNRIEQELRVELPKKHWDDGRIQTNTPDSLAMLNGDQKRLLTTYIRDYNTLRARAAIDLLAKYANDSVNSKRLGQMTVHDAIVMKTNNYLAAKLGSTADKIRATIATVK